MIRTILFLLIPLSIWGQALPFPGPGTLAATSAPVFIGNSITCSSNFSSTVSCTLPSAPISGHCIVIGFGARVAVSTTAAVINSITETNVSYVSAGTGTDGFNNSVSVWIGNVTGVGGTAVSINFGSGNNAAGLANIQEVSGIPGCNASSVDVTFVRSTSSSNSATTGAYTTLHPNDLVYGIMKLVGSACTAISSQPASPYTALTCVERSGTDATQTNYRIASATGAQSLTWGLSSIQTWLAGIVALKGA